MFSGRTIAAMLRKNKKGGSERRGLRSKGDLDPLGADRFPYGKYNPDALLMPPVSKIP